MGLYAVISDIHGNFEALQAVAKDAKEVARQTGFDTVQFVALGDVVDYGPQPNECVTWIRQHASVMIQGNHDREVLAPLREPPQSLASVWWPITLWTRRILHSESKAVLREWPPIRTTFPGLEAFSLFHSTPQANDEHLQYGLQAQAAMLHLSTGYGLFGHTHHQGYFGLHGGKVMMGLTGASNGTFSYPLGSRKWESVELNKWIEFPGKWQKLLLNPGSVGQPRLHAEQVGAGIAHDERAAYLLLHMTSTNSGVFQFRRVRYDIQKTIDLLRMVQWPASDEEHSIYKESAEVNIASYTDPRMEMVLKNIDKALTALIEQQLIPRLLGHT